MALSFLAVQGALLAYQCLGTGPVLLTIPGANGDAAIFNEVAPYLAQNFTVCTYDRRGYSNSTLTSTATADDLAMPYRLQRDADDAAALLSHVSGEDPVLVFGTSSGAIVALELLQRHAGLVDLLIAHEPPLAYVLGGSWAEETYSAFESVPHNSIADAPKGLPSLLHIYTTYTICNTLSIPCVGLYLAKTIAKSKSTFERPQCQPLASLRSVSSCCNLPRSIPSIPSSPAHAIIDLGRNDRRSLHSNIMCTVIPITCPHCL